MNKQDISKELPTTDSAYNTAKMIMFLALLHKIFFF